MSLVVKGDNIYLNRILHSKCELNGRRWKKVRRKKGGKKIRKSYMRPRTGPGKKTREKEEPRYMSFLQSNILILAKVQCEVHKLNVIPVRNVLSSLNFFSCNTCIREIVYLESLLERNNCINISHFNVFLNFLYSH